MTAPTAALLAQFARKIASAGILLDPSGLTPNGSGADNLVFAARTRAGRHLIVKTPRTSARYGTAAWAAKTLTKTGVPVAEVLWFDTSICIESRCQGLPLTGAPDRLDTTDSIPSPAVLRAAGDAGALLRRAHTVHVDGYGRLTPAGTGSQRSLLASLLPLTPADAQADSTTLRLASVARDVVADNLWRLLDPGPHLLLGDCAARHIFLVPQTGAISGFIDLDSARGGDPLADIAGFSVREHPHVVQALLNGYFPGEPNPDQTWALTLHRARIALFLLVFHASRNEHTVAQRVGDVLAADLTAITTQTPTVLPTPPELRSTP